MGQNHFCSIFFCAASLQRKRRNVTFLPNL